MESREETAREDTQRPTVVLLWQNVYGLESDDFQLLIGLAVETDLAWKIASFAKVLCNSIYSQLWYFKIIAGVFSLEVEKVGNGYLTEGLLMKLRGAVIMVWASIGPEVMDNMMT